MTSRPSGLPRTPTGGGKASGTGVYPVLSTMKKKVDEYEEGSPVAEASDDAEFYEEEPSWIEKRPENLNDLVDRLDEKFSKITASFDRRMQASEKRFEDRITSSDRKFDALMEQLTLLTANQGMRKLGASPSSERFIESQARMLKEKDQALRDLEDEHKRVLQSLPLRQVNPFDTLSSSKDVTVDASRPAPVQKVQYLKAADIGIWDPEGDVPISVWCRRLEQLVERHGEEAVLRNVDQALVKVSLWLTGLADEDVALQSSVLGWITLLKREFGVSPTEASSKLREFDYTRATSASNYCNTKMALFRDAGISDDAAQREELIRDLPVRWKETITVARLPSVSEVRRAIRDLEIAASRWPTAPSRSYGSGRDRLPGSILKNSGESSSSGGAAAKPNSTSGKRSPPYPCRLCSAAGKTGLSANHWRDDCPNRDSKRAHFLLNDDYDEHEADHDEAEREPVDDAATDSLVNFIRCSYANMVSRLPVSRCCEVVDSMPESDSRYMTGFRFHSQDPVLVLASCSPGGSTFSILADSGCGPSLCNRDLFMKLWPEAEVRQMSSAGEPLRVRAGFDGREAEVMDEYASPEIYLPTLDGRTVRIYVELHLTASPIDKPGIILGGSDMKHNNIDISYTDSCLKVGPPRQIEAYCVPMSIRSSRTEIRRQAVRATEKVKISASSVGFTSISLEELPAGDFKFTPNQRATNSGGVYGCPAAIVNSATAFLECANFSKDNVTVNRGQILGYIDSLDIDAVGTAVNKFTTGVAKTAAEAVTDFGTSLDDMMASSTAAIEEPDEIEVGVSGRDLGLADFPLRTSTTSVLVQGLKTTV